MLRWFVVFTAFLVLLAVWGSAALAQTSTPTTTTTSSSTGAFDSLSPGNQKLARALFEAQTTGSGGTTTQPLTLDEIAAKKQSGQGWGNIFKDMKSQGLVQEKNLGQVVSRYQRSTHGGTSTTRGGTYSASGREIRDGSRHGWRREDDGSDTRGYGKHEGDSTYSNSGRSQTAASGSGRSGSSYSGAGRSGGGSGHGGRGGK